MRSIRIASVSICVVGIVVGYLLLNAFQFQPPSEKRTFEQALLEHEQRKDQLIEQFNATLPHEGPLTKYQLRLLDELMVEMPYEIAFSSENCLQSGGSSSHLVTRVDSAHKVVIRGEDDHRFHVKRGWQLERPQVKGKINEIYFNGTTSSEDARYAYAEIADGYEEGDTVSGIGHRGAGKIEVICKGPKNATQTHSWSWSLFRDCPHSSN